MVKVKSSADTTEKWKRRVGQAGPDYTAGVSDASVDWEGPTKAAESNYEEGVSQGIADKRFGKGVADAGNEKWRRKTITVGPGRWTAGVGAAGPDYDKGMQPVLSAIGAASLPPRYPAGDPRNLDRVRAMNEAVHNATKGR